MYFGPHRYGKRLGFSRGMGVNMLKYYIQLNTYYSQFNASHKQSVEGIHNHPGLNVLVTKSRSNAR